MDDINNHLLASIQVLTNADLLHAIFTFLPWASEKRGSHLARCATVCRTFHEPTIRVLWRELESLLPLWHLLAPPNILFPSDDAVDDEIQHYLEAISSAQLYLDPTRWERLLLHAAHIRSLSCRTHTSAAVEASSGPLIQAVIMQNGGRTVLPLLRSMNWHSCNSPWDGAVIPFFTSTLRHVGLTTPSAEGPSAQLLCRLRESCPALESIYINHVSPALVQELLHFTRLHKVAIHHISGPEHFRTIVTKPGLISLRVFNVVGPWATPGPVISVRDLHVLAVTGTAPALSGLFTCARFHALESANLRVTSSLEVNLGSRDIVALLSLFYTAISTSRVHTLNLSLVPASQLPNDAFPPLRSLLAAILPLRELRTFTLTGLLQVMPVDDADFAALASAWPQLESLRIGGGTTSQSAVSLGALHHLANACPSLRELSLPGLVYPAIGVHAIPARTLPDPSSSARPLHPLRSLHVRIVLVPKTDAPSISDEAAEATARYLLDLFPCLDGSEYKPTPAPPHEPSPEPGPQRRRRFRMSSFVVYDGRWWKVSARIYAVCAAREEVEVLSSA